MKNECIFCSIWKEKKRDIVTQTRFFFVLLDDYPVTPGHMLIIPKRHCATLFDFTRREQKDFWRALDIAKTWRDVMSNPDGYNVGANCGEAAGQTVFHAHVHLIPRLKEDMSNADGRAKSIKDAFKP